MKIGDAGAAMTMSPGCFERTRRNWWKNNGGDELARHHRVNTPMAPIRSLSSPSDGDGVKSHEPQRSLALSLRKSSPLSI